MVVWVAIGAQPWALRILFEFFLFVRVHSSGPGSREQHE